MTIIGHFTRVHTNGYWNTGNPVPTPTDWAQFDQIISQIISGDMGGCWAPLTQIAIAGSGLTLTAPLYVLGFGFLLSTASGAYLLNNNNIPQLGPDHVGRTRVIVSPCSAGRAAYPFGAVPFFYGLQSVAQQFLFLNAAGQTIAQLPNELYVPLRVHNGATLTEVEVSFAVTQQYTPVRTPGFRIVRVDINGVQTVMTSAAAASANGTPFTAGYLSPPAPSSASAWYNGGAAQTFTVPCDQANVIDISQYTYWLQIADASGNTGYPFQLNVTPPVEVASNLHFGTANASVALINNGGLVELTYATGTFANGELVVIAGTGTAADGAWIISSVTGTTMTLNGSSYSAGTPAAGLITAGQVFMTGPARVLDGVTLNVIPAPVLVKDQFNQAANGIWNVQQVEWTRSPIPLTQGMIVPVAHGTANTGTYWQLLTGPLGNIFNSYQGSWIPALTYAVGQQVIPFNTNGGLIFTCTTPGTTAANEPSQSNSPPNPWPTSPGGTVTDGSVVWTASLNTSPPVIFAGGPTSGSSTLFPVAGQFVAQSTLFLNAAATFVGIGNVGFQ